MAFLDSIESHAIAGNFTQARLQAESLIEAMQEACSPAGAREYLYGGALEHVQRIPREAEDWASEAIQNSVHQAKAAIFIAVG